MTYGVNEIAGLFPSLMEIKDESLREKVAAVWNEAITTGCGGKGWTFDELRALKFTLPAGDIDMTFIEHLNSCARQCIAIAEVPEGSFRRGTSISQSCLASEPRKSERRIALPTNHTKYPKRNPKLRIFASIRVFRRPPS